MRAVDLSAHRSAPGRPIGGVLAGIMWAVLSAYIAALLWPGDLPLTANGVLGTLTQWLPPVCAWAAVSRTGRRRPEVWLAAVAMTAFAAGNTYYGIVTMTAGGPPGFPSWADAGYLTFHPLMLAALTLTLRRNRHGAASMWLDSVVGGLGSAACLSVVLGPVLSARLDAGLPPRETLASVAAALGDLLLVAAVTAVAARQGGGHGGRRLLLLTAGLLVFAAADALWALQLINGTYHNGTLLDGGWSLGLALVVSWVPSATELDTPTARGLADPLYRWLALAVPLVATFAAVGVLILGTYRHVAPLSVILAGLTLAAAAGRTQIAFRQLVRFAEARRQATTDDLTGLPNRRAFYAGASGVLAAADDRPLALLLLDLDKFKEVNDSLGHLAGDRLLVQLGHRLTESLRDDDLLARLGGDEFAVLLRDADADRALAIAAKLRSALAKQFVLDDLTLHTDVSIGLALFPQHGRDIGMLLRRADIAMYKAKTGREGCRVYSESDDPDGDLRLRTLQDLRTALATEQIVLHYQPKTEVATGRIPGVEALVRWDHPVRGLLYPDAFLVLAEDAGLMRELTDVVLAQALEQAAVWRDEGRDLTIAVNVSASSLTDTTLPDRIEEMLAARGLEPAALQVEITEEFLMADRDRARAVLTRLRDHGVQIAVDDFGTGYSSLAYLRDLPIDELKLDRSFVFPIADDARAAALVASTIGLAHSLGLRMVAEGVEDPVSYAELARYGCDLAQGYLISRPLPATAFELWLDQQPTPWEPQRQ